MTSHVVVSKHDLHDLATRVLQSAGLNEPQAIDVADMLVWADARGADSHGVSRIPWYVELLATGQMNASATVRHTLRLPALTILEGDRCPGPVGMKAAAAEAISAARRCGIGMCLLRDTTHTGALGYYTTLVTHADMIGIAAAASGPNMAYHNAATAGVSTSPLSIAAPRARGEDPLVFDMASGIVALGKLQQARAAHQPIPAGWALDALGRPTTDPAEARTPLPLGGPKGSGLALMMETLTSLLTDNPILAPALGLPPARRRHYQNGLLIALDVAQITDGDVYIAQVEALAKTIKGLPPLEGQDILLPGERGFRQARASDDAGIGLRTTTAAVLEDIAKTFGIAVPW